MSRMRETERYEDERMEKEKRERESPSLSLKSET